MRDCHETVSLGPYGFFLLNVHKPMGPQDVGKIYGRGKKIIT